MFNHMVLDRSAPLNRVFHALAHPARRAILQRLSGRERNLSELAAPLRMSFPAASKHVRVLERARLVRRRVAGRSHFCRLNAAPLKRVADFTEKYRRFWEARYRNLDKLLAELQATPRRARI
jgi:DNA-binding transcriptional ArsR family regulator